KGFDCSGLVKRVFLMEGIRLPRDASQQALIGAHVGAENRGGAGPADLLFFGEGGRVTHVAISLGGGRFIHAQGEVRINSLGEDDPLFEEKLAGKLLFARSVIS
ncbi:MAG: C40 family peptidase, partial [Candidatus Krumholzibacteria bacterium]|nr:C40 family peptidase [Candidatus Krumholzibacteria bacterium]